MLHLAREAVAPVADRMKLVDGIVDQAPAGPFDGATCLLVLHFLARSDRLRTLREIRRRLTLGARLVIADHAPPRRHTERWMTRSVAFGVRAHVDAMSTAAAGRLMTERLPLLAPHEEEELLSASKFVEVEAFYAA